MYCKITSICISSTIGSFGGDLVNHRQSRHTRCEKGRVVFLLIDFETECLDLHGIHGDGIVDTGAEKMAAVERSSQVG